MSACQSYRPVASLNFQVKIQKGAWPYRYAHDVPLLTLILNIYRFVDLAPFFSGQSTILALFFFEYRKGCGHIDMLMKFSW